MRQKRFLITGAVFVVGIVALALFFLSGRGSVLYVPDEAVRAREKGEFLLNKRLHTQNSTQKSELLTQAIDEFKRAIQAKPDFDVAYNMLGHCYIERGQWESALQALNKAIELRSDYPAAHYNRARVYHELSQGKRDNDFLDRAIEDYGVALNSELAAGFRSDIRKALSDAYRMKGQIPQAIRQLELFLAEIPHSPETPLVERKIRGLNLMLASPATVSQPVHP